MIETYFGSPGAGKTTVACKLALEAKKKYEHVFLNFNHRIPNAYICDLNGLGEWTFPWNSKLFIDEAGIVYNNRKFKSFPQETIAWFKLHRHFGTDVCLLSQSWEDCDVTIRRLSDKLWYVFKLGPFTVCRKVYKRVTVDQTTEQIIDGYRMSNLIWLLLYPLQAKGRLFAERFKVIYRPRYYKYFDTYERGNLPVKSFPKVSLIDSNSFGFLVQWWSDFVDSLKKK